MSTDILPTLVTRQEAAEFLGVRVQTLAKWAMTGEHLPVIHVGRSVRYRVSDLEAFVGRNTTPAAD